MNLNQQMEIIRQFQKANPPKEHKLRLTADEVKPGVRAKILMDNSRPTWSHHTFDVIFMTKPKLHNGQIVARVLERTTGSDLWRLKLLKLDSVGVVPWYNTQGRLEWIKGFHLSKSGHTLNAWQLLQFTYKQWFVPGLPLWWNDFWKML